jgi:hypothetical protein
MRIISEKRRIRYAWVLIFTAIGTGVLTYFFSFYASHGDLFDRNEYNYYIIVYCAVNTLLTFLTGIFLLNKYIKVAQYLSFILGMLVIAGFFVVSNPRDQFNGLNSVSVYLSMMGAVFGTVMPPWCGAIVVPLFLYNAFYGLYRSIGYFREKILYQYEADKSRSMFPDIKATQGDLEIPKPTLPVN